MNIISKAFCLMKSKLLFLLSFVFAVFNVYAQSIDEFCIPHFKTKEEAAKYIGHTIIVYKCDIKSPKWDDVYKFDNKFYGGINKKYMISKIKVGKQIVFYTKSEYGSSYKFPVNLNNEVNYDGLSSCNIFFSVNKFNTDKKKYIGKTYTNGKGEVVAVVEDLEIATAHDSEPKFVYTLRSKIDNKKFKCESTQVEDFCKYLGITLTHPKVKTVYKVIGGNNYFASDYFFTLNYQYENIASGEVSSCTTEGILSAPFETDLAGKYVSLLSKVEKPSNPEIRYGETIKIPSEDATSKFCYKDNVIDIMIFADASDFTFVLQNISGSTIKIVWDEAVFVNFDGSTEKVMHKGTKYAERNESQPPTTIIKNAKWEDTVIPNHLVYWYESTSKYIKSQWSTRSMYPKEKGLEPGQVMLMLPIQIRDVINEYIFVFDVKYVFEHPERLNL